MTRYKVGTPHRRKIKKMKPIIPSEAIWIESNPKGADCRLIQCSNCGLTFVVGENIPYDEWIESRKYCQQCGSRMVKQE